MGYMVTWLRGEAERLCFGIRLASVSHAGNHGIFLTHSTLLALKSSGERHFGRFFFFRFLQNKQFRRTKVERRGDRVGRKRLALSVVSHHRVIVSLARKSDLVF